MESAKRLVLGVEALAGTAPGLSSPQWIHA